MKGVAYCGSHAGPAATSDSASHEGTGRLAQLYNSDALSSSLPWALWSAVAPELSGRERASLPFLAPSGLLLADLP